MTLQVSADAADTKICGVTGLALVRSAGRSGRRIQKVSYGAMSPLQRPVAEDPSHWGRYDVAGHRTIYIASTAEGAYAESLANQRISNRLKTVRLSDVFDDSESKESPDTVLAAVKKEWEQLFGGMTPGKVVLGWRDARLEYPMTLPKEGWLVEIEASSSLAVLNANMRTELGDLGIDCLTLGDLCGEQRKVTTAVAAWVHSQVLEDGSLPHGIVYSSKHGTDYKCWAIWLRSIDDGKDPVTEPTEAGEGLEIKLPQHNRPLAKVAQHFGLKIY